MLNSQDLCLLREIVLEAIDSETEHTNDSTLPLNQHEFHWSRRCELEELKKKINLMLGM